MKENIEKLNLLFLDTCLFIYFMEGNQEFGEISNSIFAYHQKTQKSLVTSVLTLMELLPKPIAT